MGLDSFYSSIKSHILNQFYDILTISNVYNHKITIINKQSIKCLTLSPKL